MSEQPLQRTWRKWARLSVRALTVIVLFCACALGWAVHRARIQRNAVAAIERAGGAVSYDWKFKNERYIRNGEPSAPKWLVDPIGADYFGHVSFAQLGSQNSDAELEYVGQLTQLEELILLGSAVTDDGMSHLKGLSNLQRLILSGPAMTDTSLAQLTTLSRLRRLELIHTRVTEAGAQQLQKSLPALLIIRQ
jgi:hypothetical protein